jgi:hypothetical protein
MYVYVTGIAGIIPKPETKCKMPSVSYTAYALYTVPHSRVAMCQTQAFSWYVIQV